MPLNFSALGFCSKEQHPQIKTRTTKFRLSFPPSGAHLGGEKGPLNCTDSCPKPHGAQVYFSTSPNSPGRKQRSLKTSSRQTPGDLALPYLPPPVTTCPSPDNGTPLTSPASKPCPHAPMANFPGSGLPPCLYVPGLALPTLGLQPPPAPQERGAGHFPGDQH